MTSAGVEFETRELGNLVADLGKVPGKALLAISDATMEAATALRLGWISNATATAGAHGVYYPMTITAELKPGFGSVGAEVGPEEGRAQGGMGKGFEYGSVNQPPHMDGNKAADVIEPAYIALVTAAALKAASL